MSCCITFPLMYQLWFEDDTDDTREDEELWLLLRMRERIQVQALSLKEALNLLRYDMVTYCRHMTTPSDMKALLTSSRCQSIVPVCYIK